MTNAKQMCPGEWSGEIDENRILILTRLHNQLILKIIEAAQDFYCPKGKACQKLIKENRELVTITPIVSIAGSKCMCPVVPSSKTGGITRSMAPKLAVKKDDKQKYRIISTSEKKMAIKMVILLVLELFDN